MPLTQANAKSRLVAAMNNPATDPGIVSFLEDVRDRFRETVGDTPANVMNRIDQFLNLPVTHAQWTLANVQKVVALIRDLWPDIPPT